MTLEWGEAPPKRHVIIIGAGFGGLACARKLRKSRTYRVTLIDRHPYHLFAPLLYQVATAGLPEDDIAFPVRTAFREVDFLRGEVTSIEIAERRLTVNGTRTLDFDHLVLAVGSQGTTYGIEGVAEHTLQMKSVADARRIRRSLLHTYEEVEDGFLPPSALNVVVVGGGPTGVELAGAIRELQHEMRREFEDVADHASVTLIEAGPRPLPSFHEKSSAHAKKTLESMGVSVRVSTAVTKATPTSLHLSDGDELIAGTRIWAAGVVAPDTWKHLGESDRANRLKVQPTLALTDSVWVIGDAAHLADDTGRPLPMIAPVAIQQGKHVAEQLLRLARSERLSNFEYRDKGQMATIGRRKAVVEVRKWLRFSGTFAWLTWLALHLAYISGGRNRTSIFADWVWNYLVWVPRRAITD
ncbi:MAG: NAD(P)/FAD-dependent oxidoreductase [Acidimicrobiia bacterium]|nr:NAD(P)/FAD-dependent oxidoreductase [Acidimicrobiia bacterium]